jgi:hypothetical protein
MCTTDTTIMPTNDEHEAGGMCRVCGRKLNNPLLTIGPVCSRKQAGKPMSTHEQARLVRAFEEAAVYLKDRMIEDGIPVE